MHGKPIHLVLVRCVSVVAVYLFVLLHQPNVLPRCDTTGHTVENMVIKLAPTRPGLVFRNEDVLEQIL